MTEFLINNYEDRRNMVAILAEAGYEVRIEKRDIQYSINSNYFVVVEKTELKKIE